MILETSAFPFLRPVVRTEYLDRLEALPDDPTLTPALWDEVHRVVQEELAPLRANIRRKSPEIRVDGGRTQGRQFLLFSYCTFCAPGGNVDPVVAGITFTFGQEGVTVAADISGEQTGDCIVSLPTRIVGTFGHELLDAARESARTLSQSAEAITAALADASRNIQ
jgi:hypothetical protein